MVTGSRRTVSALVLSFAVYLMPLVGPHAGLFLGELMWREFLSTAGRTLPSNPIGGNVTARDPGWVAADVAVALVAQLGLLLLLYWFLGRPGLLRGLAV